MTEINLYNFQRTVTPKVVKQGLWFLYSGSCLIVLYICVKFHENISYGFQVTEWTQIYDGNHYLPSMKDLLQK